MLDLYQVKRIRFKKSLNCTLFNSRRTNCGIFKNIFIIYISLSISEVWCCDIDHYMWKASSRKGQRVEGTLSLFLPLDIIF